MTDKTGRESLKVEGETVVDKISGLIHEGNVRGVVVKHQGRTIADVALTAGEVGMVLAPVLAAAGALVALLKDCTINIERVAEECKQTPETETKAAAQ